MTDTVQHLIVAGVVALCACLLVLRVVRSARAKPGCGCATCPKTKKS